MEEKQNNKERLKEITDSIETGIMELFESDKYKSYLKTMSRFHKYSFNNTMLISMQKPDATLVAGFNKWRDGFSRFVKKGEKGIKIIAPTTYKVKEEREKLNPQTKAPILDASGKVQTEEVEIQKPTFRVVSVFDVSQTEGKPLPTLASDWSGNVEQFAVFMEAIKRTAPVPIEMKPMPKDTDGYYHTEDRRIAIREGMSEVQTVSAAIHEVAHSLLHNREMEKKRLAQQSENPKPIKPKDRNTEEVEAESISFAVCNYFGIETAENSLGYIAAWSKSKELAELRASLEIINKTSSELISGIDKHIAEIVRAGGVAISDSLEVATPVSSDEKKPPFDVMEFNEQQWEQIKIGWDNDLDVSAYANPALSAEQMKEIRLGLENNTPLPVLSGDEKLPPKLSEQLFMERIDDAFAIYQLKDGAEFRDYRFEGLDWLKSRGLSVNHANYNFIYTELFTQPVTTQDRLAEIWERFNIDHPADFKGHSLSVSDIVAIKQDGVVTYHYCDNFDFKELPYFIESVPLVPDNFVTGAKIDTPRGSFHLTTMTNEDTPLRTAELSTEQNCNQIDGILNNQPTVAQLEQDAKNGKPISLMDLLEATRREEKQSVMEQLKTKPLHKGKGKQPKKGMSL